MRTTIKNLKSQFFANFMFRYIFLMGQKLKEALIYNEHTYKVFDQNQICTYFENSTYSARNQTRNVSFLLKKIVFQKNQI